jgi:hypothetical protein
VARASTVSRTFWRIGAGALAVLVVALVIVSCSGEDDKGDGATPAPKAEGVLEKRKALKAGKVVIESAGPEVKLPQDMQSTLVKKAQTYVDTAVHDPLTAGEVGNQFAKLFGERLRGRATGRDLKALSDAGVGRASKYVETVKPVRISGLADGAGKLIFLATNVSMKVKATVDDRPVTISRDAEFTFGQSGKDWLVTAYRVKAVRKAPKGKTTTTVAANGEPSP